MCDTEKDPYAGEDEGRRQDRWGITDAELDEMDRYIEAELTAWPRAEAGD